MIISENSDPTSSVSVMRCGLQSSILIKVSGLVAISSTGPRMSKPRGPTSSMKSTFSLSTWIH